MRTSADGDLAASVLRQAEEERQYCMQKGRSVPSALSPVHSIHSVATASLEPNSPPAPVSVPSSVTDVKPTGYDMPLASLSPGYMQQQPSPHRSSSARSDDGLRGAGAIFLTRYSQRRTLSIGTPSGPHTSIPDRELTPGPGAYEPDQQRAMTSILRQTTSHADVPSPWFRSRTNRFRGHIDTFNTADPIHLFPAAQRSPSAAHAGLGGGAPSPFQRGRGHIAFAADQLAS